MSTTETTDERVYYSPFSWDGLTKEEVMERLDKIDEDADKNNGWITYTEFHRRMIDLKKEAKAERKVCAATRL